MQDVNRLLLGHLRVGRACPANWLSWVCSARTGAQQGAGAADGWGRETRDLSPIP